MVDDGGGLTGVELVVFDTFAVADEPHGYARSVDVPYMVASVEEGHAGSPSHS